MDKAQQRETDNEGYGALVTVHSFEGMTEASIGCDLPTMDYCPWCGKELKFVNG
jgi:hypothetical protein